MGYFQVRYDSRVVIYDHKLFIRLTTDRNRLRPNVKEKWRDCKSVVPVTYHDQIRFVQVHMMKDISRLGHGRRNLIDV